MNPINKIDPEGYFKCQYINEDGAKCENTTFIKEDVIKLASYKPNDFFVEEVVDIVVKCAKCGHIQHLKSTKHNVSFSQILKENVYDD